MNRPAGIVVKKLIGMQKNKQEKRSMKTTNLIIIVAGLFGAFCFCCAAAIALLGIQFQYWFVDAIFTLFLIFVSIVAIWAVHLFNGTIKREKERQKEVKNDKRR